MSYAVPSNPDDMSTIYYKLIHLLTYIVDLRTNDIEKYIENEDVNLFLNTHNDIYEIKLNNSIEYFHDVNELIFILKEKENNLKTNNQSTTKKIRISINKFKSKKTRRQY